MTFIQTLKQHKDLFEIHKYEKKAMPEVLEYLRIEKSKKNNETVYNAELLDIITQAENILSTHNLIDHLKTEIYLAQHDYTDELEEIEKQKMLDKGYLPLNSNTTYRGKIELISTTNMDWFTKKIAKEAKITELPDKRLFIIPKGNRSRGWYISSLKNAYYKPLNK